MWCPCPLVIEHWRCNKSSFNVGAGEEHADGRDDTYLRGACRARRQASHSNIIRQWHGLNLT